jgi:beta-lactamase superfamily II metal-dependent hydrolase
MKRILGAGLVVACVWLGLIPGAWAKTKPKPLRIYSIDVEGGQATLIVAPSGQSMLVDTGWPGFDGRDAARIVIASRSARVKQIDYLVITHYHRDHVGGVPQLAERMKIGTFVDHGANQEDSDVTREDYAAYLKVVGHAPRVTVKPGDGLPIQGLTVEVLTAAGEHVSGPLPGAGEANPNCGTEAEPAADVSENARSLGMLITYGKFRFLDLGDLTKKKEMELMCPNNLVGTVDLFLVSHHGWDQSNSKALVWALHPRVAIMNNGAHKGANPVAWQTVHDSPGLEDLWQLHYAVEAGPEHNVAEKFIANPEEKADDGSSIRVLAEPDGSFTVINSRNGFRKTYTK